MAAGCKFCKPSVSILLSIILLAQGQFNTITLYVLGEIETKSLKTVRNRLKNSRQVQRHRGEAALSSGVTDVTHTKAHTAPCSAMNMSTLTFSEMETRNKQMEGSWQMCHLERASGEKHIGLVKTSYKFLSL